MPRTIENFKGNNAIIGCSEGVSMCDHGSHPVDTYYSLNFDSSVNPDLCIDIRSQSFPKNLHNRFLITFVENIDYIAYNNLLPHYPSYPSTSLLKGEDGFKNLWDITDLNGFIVFSGCPRVKEFRNSIKKLKYLEFSRDPGADYYCVIVPKNQTLSIEEVNANIQLNPELTQLIYGLNKVSYLPRDYPFTFCNVPFNEFPTIQEESQGKEFIEQDAITLLNEHKAIPEISDLYESINAMGETLDNNKKLNASLSFKSYANLLIKNADNFFKYPTSFVTRDLGEFQRKFDLLIQQESKRLKNKEALQPAINKINQAIGDLVLKKDIIFTEEYQLETQCGILVKELLTITQSYKKALPEKDLEVHYITNNLLQVLNTSEKSQEKIKKFYEILYTKEGSNVYTNLQLIKSRKDVLDISFLKKIIYFLHNLLIKILPEFFIKFVKLSPPKPLLKCNQFFLEKVNEVEGKASTQNFMKV